MNTYAEYNKKLRFSLQHEKANRIFVYFVKVSKRHEKQRPKTHLFFLSVLVWQTKLIHYCLVKDDQKKT